MKKEVICTMCGGKHYQTFCPKKKNKPIKRSAINKAIKPKKTKTDRSKAKSAAWDAFSIYIRTRDCIRFTGDPTEGKCITCNRHYPFKQLQAGHFIPGRGNAVLFDERLVYSQCIGCNSNPPYGKGGNYVEYFRFMLDEVGLEKIDEFRALKNTSKVYKEYQFDELKEYYQNKTKVLLEQNKRN